MHWVKHTDKNKVPPRNRPLLAYCPDLSEHGYSVVIWTGYAFECESHGLEITDYVVQWSLIIEVDDEI